MTPQQVKQQADYINSRIGHWEDMLTKLQEECGHPNVTRTPHSNTGNWDKYSDRYWYTFDCPDCGKRWREDQ